MEIKRLESKDTENILSFESENAPEKPFYVKYTKKDLDDLFNDPQKCQAFGMYENDELIAWSAYRNEKENLYEVCSLVVDKKYRGKGLGKTLLNHVIQKALEDHKNAEIYLTVYPQNLDALFLYLKNNFVIYDFKKDYYGPGADRLFLKYMTDPK